MHAWEGFRGLADDIWHCCLASRSSSYEMNKTLQDHYCLLREDVRIAMVFVILQLDIRLAFLLQISVSAAAEILPQLAIRSHK